MSDSRYKAAGVDIEAGNRAVAQMKPAIRSTYSPAVLADVGSFGGLFALSDLPNAPVLVASIDGVGTKVKLAAQVAAHLAQGDDSTFYRAPADVLPSHAVWRGIGHDLVNHCVNDILVQNARPLFFLDYIAASRLEPDVVAQVVVGMAEACRAAGCALLGGETAEMPGVYVEGALDVAGAIVGLVDRAAVLPDQEAMAAGDVLIGLPSSGPHTNGYSLIRQALVAGDDLTQLTQMLPGVLSSAGAEEQDISVAQALLAPHRPYVVEMNQLVEAGLTPKGLAHITGGGFFDNVPRVLPKHLGARVDSRAWSPGSLFELIVEAASLTKDEAYRVLNMGVGMVLIVDARQQQAVLDCLPQARVIGELTTRPNPDVAFELH